MGFDEGQITLDSPNGAYYSGQPINGKLVFQAEKPMTFRGIYAKLKGYCKVHWTTSHTRRINDRTEHYQVSHDSEEEYIQTKTFLIGGDSGECTLQPGKYEFPFYYMLPANCPSSFEGSDGHIRYEIKVVVDRAFKLDKEKKVAVRVLSLINLNENPYCKEPMQFLFNDDYCCCCFSSGSAETVVKLPVSGYCPGQTISIEIGSSNKGSVEIEHIEFTIKKHTTFRATHNPDTKTETDKVAIIKKGPVPANCRRNWIEQMEVPAIDVCNVTSCRFIDVEYEFQVKIIPEGCHDNSKDSQQLILGHIPLAGIQDNVRNPLIDQMPSQVMAVVNQPLPTSQPVSPYPMGNYPNTSPYPNSNPPYPVAPGTNPPYPSTMPYPTSNSPFPNSNAPYPAPNPPYPTSDSNTSPYPTTGTANPQFATSPYPANTSPYPTTTPYPTSNSPVSTQSPYHGGPSTYPPPYQAGDAAFPTPQANVPYPNQSQTGFQAPVGGGVGGGSLLKTGTFGFTGVPSMPPNPMPAAPMNPFATASAPPDTPDEQK